MKAIFIVPFENDNPQLPPMVDGAGGLQLGEIEEGAIRDGCGFSCIGRTPTLGTVGTVMVLIDTSDETLDVMEEDENYLMVEKLKTPQNNPNAQKQRKITRMLAAHGRNANNLNLSSVADKKATLMQIHGITAEMYLAAGGTLLQSRM